MIFYIFCILSVYMYSPLNLFGYWTLNKHYYYYLLSNGRRINFKTFGKNYKENIENAKQIITMFLNLTKLI